ncbi:MAG TPA: Ni/Fe-hydrogenase cytochrome b subunit [Usitatibacter sp.]|nr:Ni/Fe-hydrogenase cytochrome b subunit [Usitatibacter sp.]
MATHAAEIHAAPAPLGGRLVTPTTVILGLLSLAAAGVIVVRLIYGLGAVANINDGYPWGIWIAYDLVIGSALACGGFAVSILIYIFNKGEYHPLIRPAMVASLAGYTLAGASIFFDIGRYWNFWHIFWPGYINLGSVMFELAACMTAYVLVMWIEFSPALTERFGLPRVGRAVKKWTFLIVALGVVLPTMHQSSIGAMLIVFGTQIHPLWSTLWLPLLFLISCILMGYAMVIFEASLSSVGFTRPMEAQILSRLARYMAGLLVVYLVVRFADLAWRGALAQAFVPGLKSTMFWIENALYAAPLLLLATEASRRRPSRLFLSAVLMAAAGFVYRINCFLVGYDTGPGWHYFPSIWEVLFSVGLIAFEVLVYIIAVRTLPILPASPRAARATAAA